MPFARTIRIVTIAIPLLGLFGHPGQECIAQETAAKRNEICREDPRIASSRKLVNQRRYVQAEKLLSPFLSISPFNACDSVALGDANYLKGTIEIGNDNILLAIPYLLRSLTLFEPEDKSNACRIVKALNNLGFCYKNEDKIDSSNFFLVKALDFFDNCVDTPEKVMVLINLSSNFDYLDQKKTALEYAKLAETYIRAEDHVNLFNVEYLFGNAYFGLNDWEQAEGHYLKSIQAIKGNQSDLMVLPIINLISIYLLTDRIHSAEQAVKQINKKLLQPLDQIYFERAIIEIALAKKDWKNAYGSNLLTEGIALRYLGDRSFEYGISLLYSARTLSTSPHNDSAFIALNKLSHAAEIFKEVSGDFSFDLAQTYLTKAEIYSKLNKPFWAAILLDSSYRALHPSFSRKLSHTFERPIQENSTLSENLHLEIKTLLSEVIFQTLGKPQLLRKKITILDIVNRMCTSAIDLAQLTKRYLTYERSRLSQSEAYLNLFELASKVSFDSYQLTGKESYLNAHIRSVELLKSQLLKDHLTERGMFNANAMPPEVVQLENLLTDSIAFYRRAATYESDQIRLNEIKMREFQLKLRKDSLINGVAKAFPEYYNNNYRVIDYNISEIRRKIPANTSVITFSNDRQNIFIVHITRQNVETQKVAITKQLMDKLSYLNSTISQNPILNNAISGNIQTYSSVAESLYKSLLGKLDNTLSENLIIIPSTLLAQLPFECLIKQDRSKKRAINYKDLVYLVKQHSISYSYSLDFIFSNREGASDQRNSLLIIAPDTFSNAPNTQYQLPTLHYQLQEAQTIKSKYTSSTGILSGSKATKSNFLKQFQGYTVLHFATHTTISSNPLLSGIYFQGSEADNLLTFDEIRALRWSNKGTVVLGSCNTGVGAMLESEGIISLARAFAYAGARRIFFNLWDANDYSSTNILPSLYLTNNSPGSNSLSRAKKEYLKKTDEILAHPYYWAGVVTYQM